MSIATETYTGARGSCKNPYGGRVNPSRIDFAEWIFGPECSKSGAVTGPQLLALTVLSHAASDYVFYGLGRNGYTVDKFFEAVEFFFRTRSYLPETWEDAPALETVVVENGKEVVKMVKPDPETLRMQCFDVYYELSGLDQLMELDVFLERLKNMRRELIVNHRNQIKEYLELLRRYGLPNRGGQLEFLLESTDFLDAMVCPESPEQVEQMLIPHTPVFRGLRRRFKRFQLKRRRWMRRRSLPLGQQGFDFAKTA